MKVKFFASIREYTKTKEIEADFCPTLYELLIHLCSIFGSSFSRKIFNGDKISDEIIIMINGRNIVYLQGINTVLSMEDEISIFPVIAGG